MRYQTVVVLAITAIFTFLLLSLLARIVSALRRGRNGRGQTRGPRR